MEEEEEEQRDEQKWWWGHISWCHIQPAINTEMKRLGKWRLWSTQKWKNIWLSSCNVPHGRLYERSNQRQKVDLGRAGYEAMSSYIIRAEVDCNLATFGWNKVRRPKKQPDPDERTSRQQKQVKKGKRKAKKIDPNARPEKISPCCISRIRHASSSSTFFFVAFSIIFCMAPSILSFFSRYCVSIIYLTCSSLFACSLYLFLFQ